VLINTLTTNPCTAEDKDNRLMSSEGLEATQAEMDEVLQDMEEEAELAVID
jgi:translation initiation factor eIF-2B subunit gamma